MAEMNQVTARLRLMLAEVNGREEQLDNLVRQFHTQLKRLPRQAIYGRTPLDLFLSAMGEIEERLNDALATRQRLLAIKKQAEEELKALELTRHVEEAKQSLQELQHQTASEEQINEEAAREIRRLEEFIAAYSKITERSITEEGSV